MVVWHELKRSYSFVFFPKVLYRKIQHFMNHGKVMDCGGAWMGKDGKITCTDKHNCEITALVDTSNGFSTAFRANSAVMEQVVDILFSTNNTGLQFNTTCKMEVGPGSDYILRRKFTCSVDDKTCIKRCGSFVGDSLEGSDGFCGPDNGPGCSSCMKRQGKTGDEWEFNVMVKTNMVSFDPPEVWNTEVYIDVVLNVNEEDSRTEEIPSPVKRVREPECVICMGTVPTHAATPCGHKCVCQGCMRHILSNSVRTCPVCRKNVREWIQIFD
jgi:hypothetical protein